MLNHAKEWGYLKPNIENPASKVRYPKIPKREMDCLSPEEAVSLLDAVHPKWRAFFLVAISGGLRMGELLAMRWANLEWSSGQYHVRDTWKRERGPIPGLEPLQIRFGPPKSESSRAPVDLVSEALAELREHRRRQSEEKIAAGPRYADQDLIFATRLGQPHNDANIVRRVFQPALENAGLRRIRFHDLRHTCASILIDIGVSPKYVQKQLRHASIEMTFNTYGHLFPDANREATRRMSERLFGSPPMTGSLST